MVTLHDIDNQERLRNLHLRGFEVDELKLHEVQIFIDNIDDPIARKIAILRSRGHSYNTIALHTHYADESGPRKVLKRYMERLENEEKRSNDNTSTNVGKWPIK